MVITMSGVIYQRTGFESACQVLEYGGRMLQPDVNPLGILAMAGDIPFPCHIPRVPTLPDLVHMIYYEILPNCLANMLSNCWRHFKNLKITDAWIIDKAFRGKTVEEAEEYWQNLKIVPFIVLMGKYKNNQVFIFLESPFVAPGQPVISRGMVFLRRERFIELYGPGGADAPDLLMHYKHYKIRADTDGRVFLEEDDKPYYEVESDEK